MTRRRAVTRRDDDGEETAAGALVKAGRQHDFTYDAAGWLEVQLDHGTSSGNTDDQRITNTFWPTGWEKQRDVYRHDGSTWRLKQTSTWEHFGNGKLKQLTIKNGCGTLLQSHTVAYTDPSDVYVNGHRTKDVYTLAGPDASAPCRTTPCTATYTYDPRDRLVKHNDGHGSVTDYTLDAAGNIATEAISGTGAATRTYAYTGDQLKSVTSGSDVQKYFYDPDGNLDCVTIADGTNADCNAPIGGTVSSKLLADYAYDYLNRLASFRSFTTTGTSSTKDDAADYSYDALDRVVEETESHGATGSPRTTLLSHLGLTQFVTGEEHRAGSPTGSLITSKSYAVDAFGHRIGVANSPAGGTSESFTYGFDVHGSVSLLIDQAGAAKASYGYRAYGAEDTGLSKGDTNKDDPLNPYRYSGKRFDSGSGSLDMGARRFGPDINRFLQQDQFNGALADLDLGIDPLTQNRYALAAGNPVSFVELDGHKVTANGGGGGATAPTPTSSGGTSSGGSFDTEENPVENAGGFVKGAVDAGVENVQGLLELGGMVQRSVNPNPQVFVPQWNENIQIAQAIHQDPGGAVSSVWHGTVDPISEDWDAGRPGEAAGRTAVEGGSLAGGVGVLGKLAKLTKLRLLTKAAGGADAVVPPFQRSAYGRVSDASRAAVYQGNPVCVYCGRLLTTTIDHINSLKQDWLRGGYADDFSTRTSRVNDPTNLAGACRPCNSGKGARPIGTGPGEWWPPGWPVDVWFPFGGPPG